MRLDQLEPGMTLYDVHSERAGNTTMRVEGCWMAQVVSVHLSASPPYAMLAWNHNPARKHFAVPKGWKLWPKEWLRQELFGGGRSCAICHGKEGVGHSATCRHPRAVRAREKAAKAALRGAS